MELEMKVMWCKGLTAFNFFQKLTVYAAVSITTSDEKIQLTQDQKQEQKTPVDQNGAGNPEWNHPMKFDLGPLHNVNSLSLLFELRSVGQIFGDKTIGEVRVPLKELIQSVGSHVVRFVKYEVRNPEGKHNGILDFSYKLIPNNSHQKHATNSIVYTNNNHHHRQLVQTDTNTGNHIDLDESLSTSNPEKIEYPKIDLDEHPLVYLPPSSSTYATHYQPSYPPSYYPPLLQQPYVYTPPPPPPYGDSLWGNQRSGSYHYW